MYVTRACLHGIGDAVTPMISSIMQVIMRIASALILTKYIGVNGIFFGEVLAWIGAEIILLSVYYKYIKSNTFKLIQ